MYRYEFFVSHSLTHSDRFGLSFSSFFVSLRFLGYEFFLFGFFVFVFGFSRFQFDFALVGTVGGFVLS